MTSLWATAQFMTEKWLKNPYTINITFDEISRKSVHAVRVVVIRRGDYLSDVEIAITTPPLNRGHRYHDGIGTSPHLHTIVFELDLEAFSSVNDLPPARGLEMVPLHTIGHAYENIKIHALFDRVYSLCDAQDPLEIELISSHCDLVWIQMDAQFQEHRKLARRQLWVLPVHDRRDRIRSLIEQLPPHLVKCIARELLVLSDRVDTSIPRKALLSMGLTRKSWLFVLQEFVAILEQGGHIPRSTTLPGLLNKRPECSRRIRSLSRLTFLVPFLTSDDRIQEHRQAFLSTVRMLQSSLTTLEIDWRSLEELYAHRESESSTWHTLESIISVNSLEQEAEKCRPIDTLTTALQLFPNLRHLRVANLSPRRGATELPLAGPTFNLESLTIKDSRFRCRDFQYLIPFNLGPQGCRLRTLRLQGVALGNLNEFAPLFHAVSSTLRELIITAGGRNFENRCWPFDILPKIMKQLKTIEIPAYFATPEIIGNMSVVGKSGEGNRCSTSLTLTRFDSTESDEWESTTGRGISLAEALMSTEWSRIVFEIGHSAFTPRVRGLEALLRDIAESRRYSIVRLGHKIVFQQN